MLVHQNVYIQIIAIHQLISHHSSYKETLLRKMEKTQLQRIREPRRAKFNSPNYSHNNYYLANDELPPERSSLKFPATREIYEYVQNKEKLTELLNIEQKRRSLLIDIKIHESGAKFVRNIIVVCYSCGNKLLLKYGINKFKNQTRYKLHHFDNTHLHENQKSIFVSKMFRYKIFMKELENQDKNVTVKDFGKYLQRKYNITEKDFKYFFSNIQEKRDQQMQSLINFLKENNSRIWMSIKFSPNQLFMLGQFDFPSNYTKDPDFIMLSVGYMMQNSKLFGRVCYFSVIPGFITNKSKNGQKSWEVITFSGLNHFNELVPFALAFLDANDHSIQALTTIIQKFMKEFAVTPEIIITPYSDFYKNLMINTKTVLKVNLLHLYDAICYIETVGQQLEDICNRAYFQNIILSKQKFQFKEQCKILLQKVVPSQKNMEIFNKLVQIAPQMCFGLIDTHLFIGHIFKYSANKFMLNLIRQIFTKGIVKHVQEKMEYIEGAIVRKKWKNSMPTLIKSVFLIVRAVIKYDKDIHEDAALRGGYCQWRGQNYLDIPQMQNIRLNIKKEFLDLIMQQYGKIFDMEAVERELKDPTLKDMKTFDVYDRRSKSIFVVSACPQYSPQQQFIKFIWRCNCCYSLKSGLPCGHEIKVVVTTDTSLYDQIHQLWLKKRVIGENLKRRGRTKGTRRNTQK